MNRSIKTAIIINASKEVVWNILTDFTQYSNWNPFIIGIKGDLTPGSRLTNTMLNRGKRFVFKPKVLKVIPNQYFDWLGSLWIKGIFDGHHFFDIEEVTTGQVKLSHGENFSGILSNSILKRIGNDTRNNFIKMNAAIKQMAENNR
jgi:hypothetical protein